ncbi:MAG TPA: tRNA (guanosine(37)-N1)-methyltransferase TrmD [Candidatus Syntrophosphaera sp.]|nr:tRNA (guanosine(37)-N1)-methyltransferase TrmD [Candidatus Syntrophosphaera sp.]
MKIDVLSLFPGAFASVLESSMIAKAIHSRALQVDFTDWREFSTNKHRQVDDYPFGGFPGMVIQAPAVYAALTALLADDWAPVIYFTPQGRLLKQDILKYYATLPRVILLCGHYKELDQRLRDIAVSDEISLGDYVLSGGELPALAFIDGVARLLPGVLGDSNSAHSDSFGANHPNLGFPCYTRPETWLGQAVPPVLRGGNHRQITKWSEESAQKLTRTRRPELLDPD